jgi:hypothetical protein
MNTKTQEALKLAMEAAYLAGFNASGEGYNGEYPFGDKNRNPEQDATWLKDRDNFIREALASKSEALMSFQDGAKSRSDEEQPAQQPYDTHAAPGQSFDTHSRMPPNVPTARASKQWVGLTDEEILEVWCIHLDEGDEDEIEEWRHVINEAREIEAKLKEKNGF